MGVALQTPEPIEVVEVYLEFPNGETFPQDPQLTVFRVTDATVLATTKDRANRKTLGPAIVRRSHGKGNAVYIGSGLEATYYESRLKILRTWWGGLFNSLLGGARRPYEFEYRPGLMPHLVVGRDSLVLHLLADTGNKWKQSRTREDFLPIVDVPVRIRIPEGRQARRVSLLRASEDVPFVLDASSVILKVPRILVHEAVHVELA